MLRIPFVVLCLLSVSVHGQITLHVDANGGAAFTTIQSAVAAALPGDTILVHPGLYDERVTLSRNLTVRSTDGPSATQILPTMAGTAVSIVGSASTVTFEGFTLKGHGTSGSVVDTDPGGVLVAFGAVANIRHCIIRDSIGSSPLGPPMVFPTVAGGAGGMTVDTSSLAVVENCLFLDNQGGAGMPGAGGPGGLLVQGTCNVIHCVFTGNTGGTGTTAFFPLKGGGGAIELGPQGHVFVSNSILRGDQGATGSNGVFAADEIEPPEVTLFATAAINHSNFAGPIAPLVAVGPGVIDADPLYVDPVAGDFSLSGGSPCIDSGDCAATDPLGRDLSGHPRLRGFAPDMGALEFPHDTTRMGTSEDILLTTVINGNLAGALANTKPLAGGDTLLVHWESPCGTLDGAPYFLVAQFYAPAAPPVPFTPTIYLDSMGASIVQGPAFLPSGGADLTFNVPPGTFAPAIVRVQLLVVTPISQALFGIASSDAQDLLLQ